MKYLLIPVEEIEKQIKLLDSECDKLEGVLAEIDYSDWQAFINEEIAEKEITALKAKIEVLNGMIHLEKQISLSEEDIKKKAQESIKDHPFPDEPAHFYPPSAVTDIQRRTYARALRDLIKGE